jgi:hypothetical protein
MITPKYEVFCSPLYNEGADKLIVKSDINYQQQCVLLANCNQSFVADVLIEAAECNRPDIVSALLHQITYLFDGDIIDLVVVHADAYNWEDMLIDVLERRKEKKWVPEDTLCDFE